VSFDAYSPKAFASIKPINYVLASRCIRVASEMATAEERKALADVAQNMHRLEPEIADIRDRLYCWMLSDFHQVHQAYTVELLEAEGIIHLRNREREMWVPLLSIAMHIDDRRFPDQTIDPPADQLLVLRLIDLQKGKQSLAESRETQEDLSKTILAITYEAITSKALAPVRADFDGSGALFVIKELADLCQETCQEAGHVGPDAKITSRMVTGFLSSLDAIDPSCNERTKYNGKAVATCRIQESRLLAAMERYGVTPTG
jgi:hypothetical protein